MTAASSRPVGRTEAPLTWVWPDAVLGAVIAVPGAIAALQSVPRGLALAVGVLPSAIIGLQPTRRARAGTVVLGVLIAVPLVLGSLLSHVPWLAVPALFLLCLGAAVLSAGHRLGQIALVLSLPMCAIGLSYQDVGESVGLGLLMVAGSVVAFVVSLAWPEQPVPPARATAAVPMVGYGVRLGLAAATAAAIGFALELDHVGWACAAALLVMRPSAEMVEERSVGRIVSVSLGAMLAAALATVSTTPAIYSLCIVVALAAAAATHRSRWYVTSLFSTFLALSLLVYSNPDDASSRLVERFIETALGVGLACLFGLLVPAFWAARPPRAD
jgi:Fusaric acid resistance protein-like